MKDVTITLSPHDAMIICSFLNEFKADCANQPKTQALGVAINNYTNQCATRMTHEQITDAKAEVSVNALLGKCPPLRG